MITRKNRVEPNLILQSVNNVTNCKGNKKEKHFFFSVFVKYSQLIQPRLNPGFIKITGSGIKFLQQFWDQEVQRWVETATATEKRENTIEKYQQRNQASSSIPETTGLKFRLGTYVNLLKPWLGLLNVTWGAFHILRNSGNSGWDGNGTHLSQAFHWKVPGNNWNFKKVVLFSRWKISGEKAWSIYEFSQGITGSSSLFTAISKPPSWILVTKV